MRSLCERPDAQKHRDGLSCIPRDIVDTILRNYQHWDHTRQLIRVCKRLVDAIGNLESWDANFADAMLELLGCALHMIKLEFFEQDDVDFSYHAKSVFTREFHTMNTTLHWFTLFLHPQCRRLAISQAAKSRTFNDAADTALDLAKKWGWGEDAATKLLANLNCYYIAKEPFCGSKPNAREWWEGIILGAEECPLKSMAIILFSLVPHTADVERLFSNLGGIQGVRRSRLTVRTFETLGRLRCHYTSLLRDDIERKGQTWRRTQAHTHTREGGGINTELAIVIEKELTIRPVLTSLSSGEDVSLDGPEMVSVEDVEAAFQELEGQGKGGPDDMGAGVLSNSQTCTDESPIPELYDFDLVEKVLSGQTPNFVVDDHQTHHNLDGSGATWDKESLKAKVGLV